MVLFIVVGLLSVANLHAGAQSVVYERSIKNKSRSIQWHCSSTSNYTISSLSDESKKRTVAPGDLKLSVKNNRLTINGKEAGVASVRIATDDGHIQMNCHEYEGALRVELDGRSVRVVHEPVVPEDLVAEKKEKNHLVRVLLNEQGARGGTEWILTCPDGFIVTDMSTKKNVHISHPQLRILSAGATILINGKRYSCGHLCIMPKNGHIHFNDQPYHGAFSVVLHKDQRLLINTLCLEEYVCCVLRSESWPGWPIEVNKAFAIASRSYVLAMVMRAQESKLPYHIKNTNAHQTYKGAHTNELLYNAVAQTKGVFLTYDNKPIIAMFDSCCGGVIPAKITGFDFLRAPYLARNYPCTYCKSCSLYEWRAEYSIADLSAIIGAPFSLSHLIKCIKVAKKDDAGLVRQVSIKGARHTKNVTGKNMYSLLKKVKSYCFSIEKKDNIVILKGRGFGHHVGLCQWGAREMVRVGKGYKDILMFYYPGTEFACLH